MSRSAAARHEQLPLPLSPRLGDFFVAGGVWHLCVASPTNVGGLAGKVVKGCEVRNFLVQGKGRRRRVVGVETEEGLWWSLDDVENVQTQKVRYAEVERE